MADAATPAGTGANYPEADVAGGKTLAILCYIPVCAINLVCTIIALVQKNNHFAVYHAKQSLGMMILGLLLGVAYFIVSIIFAVGAGAAGNAGGAVAGGLGCIIFLIIAAIGLAMLVLIIMGIVNAASGKYKPVPLVGAKFEDLFKGIQAKA